MGFYKCITSGCKDHDGDPPHWRGSGTDEDRCPYCERRGIPWVPSSTIVAKPEPEPAFTFHQKIQVRNDLCDAVCSCWLGWQGDEEKMMKLVNWLQKGNTVALLETQEKLLKLRDEGMGYYKSMGESQKSPEMMGFYKELFNATEQQVNKLQFQGRASKTLIENTLFSDLAKQAVEKLIPEGCNLSFKCVNMDEKSGHHFAVLNTQPSKYVVVDPSIGLYSCTSPGAALELIAHRLQLGRWKLDRVLVTIAVVIKKG